MRTIAIDPSLRSLGLFYSEDGVFDSDVIQRTEPNRIDVLARLCLKFAAEAKLGWDLCVIEAYDPMAKGDQKYIQCEIGGLIRGIFAARKVPIIEVPIQTWKMVTGIRMKKGRTDYDSAYLNEVAKMFHYRFKTVDEADAFMLYHTVKQCGLRTWPGREGPAKIKQQLEDLHIDPRKM